MASDEEWYKIVERGLRLDFMDTVNEADIFRDHNGNLVLNGAMGVPKLKRLPDGSTVELQRFISNLVPVNAKNYFRRLRGVSSLLRPALDLLFLMEAKLLKLIRRTWSLRSTCFARLQSGGEAVAITTVPMGWVGAVDLAQRIARRLVFNIAGIPRASEVSSAGSFSLLPTAWFAWMAWMWSVRQTLQPMVRPRL